MDTMVNLGSIIGRTLEHCSIPVASYANLDSFMWDYNYYIVATTGGGSY